VLSGTAGLGSNPSYQFEIQATNVGGTRSQFFTLVVDRIAQSITFASPGTTPLATGQVTLNASSPGGNVIYTAVGPGNVCTLVPPDKVSLVGVGTCSVTAIQGATIDLWFPSASAAAAWGRRAVTITLH
jgi:hypothetical protein